MQKKILIHLKKIVNECLKVFALEMQKTSILNSKMFQVNSIIKKNGISVIIDVGANKGQFAKEMIGNGFRERIISIEPLRECHIALKNEAKKYSNWLVYKRCGLGRTNRKSIIHVSQNLVSSSILTICRKNSMLSNVKSIKKMKKLKLKN